MDDEELDAGSSQSPIEAGEQFIGNTKKTAAKLKKLAKAIHSIISAIFTFIAAFWWLILIVLVIVLIVGVVVMAVNMGVSTVVNGMYENGKYTPGGGAMGDKFYGERYLYYDNQFSGLEISDTYTQICYNLIKKTIDDEIVVINNFAQSPADSLQVAEISLDFAKSISSLNDDGMSITYYINGIDHYGLTETESELFLNKVTDYLVTYKKSTVSRGDIYNTIKNAFDLDYQYMTNVCKKIIIKDYIFDSEFSGVKEIEAKNYGGIVFMPKEDITIKDVEFGFIIAQGYNVNANYYNVQNEDITVLETTSDNQTSTDAVTADSSWFEDGMIQKGLDVKPTEYPLAKFNALDENNLNYLSSGVSLFKLLKDNKFITYFNNIEISYETSIETLLQNVNTNSYQFLKCDSDAYYIVADVFTVYE